eukprot:GGOE01040945.1.p2 GENE.GGOE01040945.1~~GGOE01040945.1.p2  ORF type:complete len:664 (+),score=248.97 GGOE01040945.1:96-1994(+)
MEAQQQYLQAALCVLQERINEVELARTLLWKEKERYALQWEQAKQDREALDHRLEMCQQETDNYALACIQVQQQMESLTLATEHAEKEKEGYMRSREDFQRDVDGLQLQLAQLAKEQEKVEAQKTAYSLVLQEKKELLTQLKSAREEVAILKSSQQDMQLTLQKLYQEQQLVVSTQEASSKEREFSQVMYRKMLEQQRETQDQLQEKLRMEKQEWELKRLALEKELSDLTFACAAKDRDTRMAQQALARLQSELADTNAGLLASEKQRLELKARLDALELDNLDLGMGLRREQAQNADLRSEVGVLQAEAGDLRNTVVAQEGIFKKRMEVQAVDQSAAWMETVKSRHIAERRQQAVLIENLEKEKRALETHVLQVGHEMEELKHRHQLQTRELERQVEAKERERHLMEERLELWRAEFITHGTSSSADSQLSPVELPVSSGAVERRSPTSSPKQRGDALDFSSIPTGVAHQLMGRLADSEESKREFHAVRRRVEQLVNKALLADKPEEAPLVIDPVAAAIPDFLALGPQHFRAVPVTLGQLVQLRCLFTEIDVQGVGAIDAEGLAGWCTMRGMQQVLFPHLEAFIAAADVWQRGTIGFWGWVALQTYLLRDLRAQGVGIAEWVAFCTQEPYR